MPSAADWQESETYRTTEYGLSFDYDPSVFRIKEIFNEYFGPPTVYITRDDWPEVVLAVTVLEMPSSWDSPSAVAKGLDRYAKEFASGTDPDGLEVSDYIALRLHGWPAVAFDWSDKANEIVPVDTHYRIYDLAGSRWTYEITLGVPEEQWPLAWPAFEGIVASFRAE